MQAGWTFKSAMRAVICAAGLSALAAAPALAQEAAPADAPAEASAPAPMQTIQGDFITAVYNFRAAGFSVGVARLTTELFDDRYYARSYMRTDGLAEMFFKSRYILRASGRMDHEGRVLPARYDNDFEGRGDNRRRVGMIYDNEGIPLPVIAWPPYGRTLIRNPVTDDQRRFSVDPLSAWTLMVLGASASEDHPCGERLPVFDGRRRYDLRFELVGVSRVDVRSGTFSGDAYRCKLHYEPVAGFKPKDPGDDALPVPPLEAWIAHIEGPSGRTLYVPVQVQADTPIGKVTMQADELKMRLLEKDAI